MPELAGYIRLYRLLTLCKIAPSKFVVEKVQGILLIWLLGGKKDLPRSGNKRRDRGGRLRAANGNSIKVGREYCSLRGVWLLLVSKLRHAVMACARVWEVLA